MSLSILSNATRDASLGRFDEICGSIPVLRALHRVATLLASVIVAAGCVTLAGVPNPEDRHAPSEVYESIQRPNCGRFVEMLAPHQQPARAYKTVASLSVTCHNGVNAACDRRLRERACELGGDALMLFESQSAPIPLGSARRTDIVRSGQVIRFVEVSPMDAGVPPDASVMRGTAGTHNSPMSR
jgi:hypothetical protein